jgi:hypothetical protein
VRHDEMEEVEGEEEGILWYVAFTRASGVALVSGNTSRVSKVTLQSMLVAGIAGEARSVNIETVVLVIWSS